MGYKAGQDNKTTIPQGVFYHDNITRRVVNHG